jgi:hypothetical protein
MGVQGSLGQEGTYGAMGMGIEKRPAPQLGVLQHLHLLDAILGKDGRGAPNGPEIEAPVLLARGGLWQPLASAKGGGGKRLGTAFERLPLARVMKLPPSAMKRSTYASIRPAVVGPKDPEAKPAGVLAGPA